MKNDKNQKCLHDTCSECHGEGVRKDGSPCIHYISCPCSKCNPFKFQKLENNKKNI